MRQAECHLTVSASTQPSRARLRHYKHKSRASNWTMDTELEKKPTPFLERNIETVLQSAVQPHWVPWLAAVKNGDLAGLGFALASNHGPPEQPQGQALLPPARVARRRGGLLPALPAAASPLTLSPLGALPPFSVSFICKAFNSGWEDGVWPLQTWTVEWRSRAVWVSGVRVWSLLLRVWEHL